MSFKVSFFLWFSYFVFRSVLHEWKTKLPIHHQHVNVSQMPVFPLFLYLTHATLDLHCIGAQVSNNSHWPFEIDLKQNQFIWHHCVGSEKEDNCVFISAFVMIWSTEELLLSLFSHHLSWTMWASSPWGVKTEPRRGDAIIKHQQRERLILSRIGIRLSSETYLLLFFFFWEQLLRSEWAGDWMLDWQRHLSASV